MIAPDKVLHLKLGAALAALLLGVLLIARYVGPGFAVAIGSVALGIGVELYQRMRNDGVADVKDAAATSAAGVVAGLLYEAVRHMQGSL